MEVLSGWLMYGLTLINNKYLNQKKKIWEDKTGRQETRDRNEKKIVASRDAA